MIKRSSLQYLDEEDQLGEYEAYEDYCTCGAGQGRVCTGLGTASIAVKCSGKS